MKRTEQKSYREGSVFCVPLRSGGFSVGIVARANLETGILLGYFWGRKHRNVPEISEVDALPETAILKARFGDLGLTSGTWPVIGSISWDRERWPVPQFVRRDALSGTPSIVEYANDDPGEQIVLRPSDSKAVEGMPRDGLYGYGAVEITLTRLLAENAA